MMLRHLLPALLLCPLPLALSAQTAPLPLDQIRTQEQLSATITALDAQVFDAYNTCNLERFSALFSQDVEFYHDQGGVTLGNQALTASVRKNICGTTTRELVPGTLKVYPMKGFGAIEMGEHLFQHPWKQDHGVVGRGRFIMLWQFKDGVWKITRVLSYDHGLVK